jgi:hypothetical protein
MSPHPFSEDSGADSEPPVNLVNLDNEARLAALQ